jgi:hypothetical protein
MRENLDSSFDFQGVDGDYFAVAFIDSRSSVEFIEARRSGGISLESIDPKPKNCLWSFLEWDRYAKYFIQHQRWPTRAHHLCRSYEYCILGNFWQGIYIDISLRAVLLDSISQNSICFLWNKICD